MKQKTIITTLIILLVLVTLTGVGVTSYFVIKNYNQPKTEEVEETPKEEEPTPEPEPEPEEEKEFSYIPIMYKVCDSDSCIHILGSMHIGDERITKYDPKVLEIYSNSDSVAFELSDEEMNKMNVKDFIYKDGTTIKDHISSELNDKLVEFGNKHKSYVYDVYKYYNLGMNSTVIENIVYEELDFKTEGADDYFMKKAKQDGKEIISIEKLEDQLKPLVGFSDDFYEKQIEQTIGSFEMSKVSAKLLYGIYLKGDEKSLSALLNKSYSNVETEEEKKYVKELIIDRNDKMTNAAKDYLANNKNVLIIVGAAHLVYEENGMIPSLSKNESYTITRIE